MEKLATFFKTLGEAAQVIGQFPLWLKVVCLVSAVYILLVGGIFIYQYSKHAALLKTLSTTTALEKRALAGDAAAMIELSFSDSPRALDILSATLRSNPQEEVRQNAVNALANIKGPAKIQVLGEILVSEKWLVAGTCAQALGRSGDVSAVPYLLRALELRIDWVVAQKSAEALGNFPPTDEIARALVRAMNEADSFAREAAMQSLVKYGTFSLPYVLNNLEASNSALTETIHAVRILGTSDKAKVISALGAARTRIATLDLPADQKHRLDTECDAALKYLQQVGPVPMKGTP